MPPAGGIAAAVRALDSEADALASAMTAACRAPVRAERAAPRPGEALGPLQRWAARTLALVLRWLGDPENAEAVLQPGSAWLQGGPQSCAEAAERIPTAVSALAKEVGLLARAGAPHRKSDSQTHRTGTSQQSLPAPSPARRGKSAAGRPPTGASARRAPAGETLCARLAEAFDARCARLSLLAGEVVCLLVPLRRQHLMVVADAADKPPTEADLLPLPAAWAESPFSGGKYPLFEERAQCRLEPMKDGESSCGLRLCLFSQTGLTPVRSPTSSPREEQPQQSLWDDFTLRVHISPAQPQLAAQLRGPMRLVCSPQQNCELTEVSTSLPDAPVLWRDAAAGTVVRMVPGPLVQSLARAPYLGTVQGRTESTVEVAWHAPGEGGPPDGALPSRVTAETRGTWTKGGPKLVRETWRPPPPDGDGGVTVQLPPIPPGGERDLLVLGRVRCVGITELVFRVGAAPWEDADKRRLRVALAAAIQESPEQLRFAQTSEVAEDGCAKVHAAFPHHSHPRLAQRQLLALAQDSAENSELPLQLLSATPVAPTAADLVCSLHVAFTDGGSPRRGQNGEADPLGCSNLSFSATLPNSSMSRKDSKVSFKSERDVAHSLTECVSLAERGGQASGRVREEIFRQNLCSKLVRGMQSDGNVQGSQLAATLESPLYDHPLSELRQTRLCRELLWIALGGEVALNDPQEWRAIVQSLQSQRHIANPVPIQPGVLRRHVLYAPPQPTTLHRLREALIELNSELVRAELEAQWARARQPLLALQPVEAGERRAVVEEEARQRQGVVQANRPPPAGSVRSNSGPQCTTRPQGTQRQAAEQPRNAACALALRYPPPAPSERRSLSVRRSSQGSVSSGHTAPQRPPRGGAPPAAAASAKLRRSASSADAPPPRRRAGTPSRHRPRSRPRGAEPRRQPAHAWHSEPRSSPTPPHRPAPAAVRCSESQASVQPPLHNGHSQRHPDTPTRRLFARSPADVASPGTRSAVTAPEWRAPSPRLRPNSPNSAGGRRLRRDRHALTEQPGSPRPSSARLRWMMARSRYLDDSPLRGRESRLVDAGSTPGHRPSWVPRESDVVQVRCGLAEVEALCAASPGGWRGAMASCVGRCGAVVAVNSRRQTAHVLFGADSIPTHHTGVPMEWPWAVLQRADPADVSPSSPLRRALLSPRSSPRRTPLHTPAAAASPAPAAVASAGAGRAPAAAAKPLQLRLGSEAAQRRWARLACLFAAPAAAAALVAAASEPGSSALQYG
eukprot:TRINITY_DN19804_c0_g1_i2.p1 TRINITY_DN19804_c0_g1~~TRINITY_DN19804_c0_g1_i2.p1  ORF type:complete len:1270 (+),score=261.55 TRINITY_DN19804_c0_g1_i2:67-3810(+)